MRQPWIPPFAGMTTEKKHHMRWPCPRKGVGTLEKGEGTLEKAEGNKFTEMLSLTRRGALPAQLEGLAGDDGGQHDGAAEKGGAARVLAEEDEDPDRRADRLDDRQQRG